MQTPAENIPPPLADEWAGCTGDGGTGVAVAGDRCAWFCTAYGKKNGQPLRAYRSSDRGQTWSVSEMPFPLDGTVRGVTTLIFQDSLIGFAGLGGSGARARGENLAKTIDGGKTWTLITPFISGLRMNTLCFVPGTNFGIMVASTTAGLICSPDGGESWQKLDSDKFYGISFVSPTCGWGTTDYRMIGKFIWDLSAVQPIVDAVQENLPHTFLLRQNYPNPFNPATTIEYSLPRASFVTLKVFDLLGREVRTLVHEQQSAAAHSVLFEAGELPSNIYFYKLEWDGACEIRKMALVR
ncbi:T9SS type A sorting domain-containing protein [candidate division KSB1 bacterium]|nr:T9SS type A sorting domain-containing protein [candidate division KSB1 bacterium]